MMMGGGAAAAGEATTWKMERLAARNVGGNTEAPVIIIGEKAAWLKSMLAA